MLEKGYYDKADAIIESHGAVEASLIPIIQDIQSEYRYLPPELLSYVADKIGITEAKAFSVATFYENFSFEPKGKYVIKVCDGEKVTTDDMLFTVETVSCLGACGLAPVLTVNDKVYPSMTPDDAAQLLQKLREEE